MVSMATAFWVKGTMQEGKSHALWGVSLLIHCSEKNLLIVHVVFGDLSGPLNTDRFVCDSISHQLHTGAFACTCCLQFQTKLGGGELGATAGCL